MIAPWWRLDSLLAANAIQRRSPQCAPGLDMELSLAATGREDEAARSVAYASGTVAANSDLGEIRAAAAGKVG